MELTLDFESRSPIDIKRCGMYVYWQSPYTVPMMLSVKVDDEPTGVWIAPQFRHLMDTEITDRDLTGLVNGADLLIAHNAGFERQGFKYGMTRLGFSDIPLEKVRCTQAQALMCALPRDLDSVARITSGGKWLKDKEGHNLMLKMSKPRMLVKAECVPLLPLLIEAGVLMEGSLWQDVRRIQGEFLETLALNRPHAVWQNAFFKEFLVYRENEQDFRRLVEYARQDTEVERYVYKQLPKIPEQELRVWFHDQRINDRGIGVDRESCEGLKRAVDIYVDQLSSHALSLTEGRVTSMKAPASITSWLREHGVETPSIDKEHVKELLDSELPPVVREFLEIRQKTGKSSVAKYEALLNYSTVDGRFRGFASYHAASTGRWGGNGPQLQNLPRPSEKNFVRLGENDKRDEVLATPDDIALLVSCDFELVEWFWKDVMVLAADLIRPMLLAKEGHDFVCADFSSVEARGIAYLARQEDKLEKFRQGLEIYKIAAAGIYKIPYEQVDGGGKGPQRQVGKTAELACLGLGTMIETFSGTKPIEEVTDKDLVFDGEQWVRTEGAKYMGDKRVMRMFGIEATEDHLWEFGEKAWLSTESMGILSGECLGILKHLLGENPRKIMSCADANCAEKNMKHLCGILLKGLLQDVGDAPTLRGRLQGQKIMECQKYTGEDGLIDCTQPYRDVLIQKMSSMKTMVQEASMFVKSGAEIRIPFLDTFVVLTVGTGKNWKWIASITIEGTNQATYVCQREEKTTGINGPQELLNIVELSTRLLIFGMSTALLLQTQELLGSSLKKGFLLRKLCNLLTEELEENIQSKSTFRALSLEEKKCLWKNFGKSTHHGTLKKVTFKKESIEVSLWRTLSGEGAQLKPTFDLINCGKNNKFTIQTSTGKAVVHNCNYGGGWGAMLRFGADKKGLTEEEGKEIVKAWRLANYKIVEFWYALREASLAAMKFPGERIHADMVSFRKRGSFLTLRLPSGRDLFYPNAKTDMCDLPWEDRDTGKPAQAKLVTAMTLTAAKQWVRRPLSHVVLSENVTQAFCRDLLAYGIDKAEQAGYPELFHAHDEAMAEVPEGFGSVEEYETLLATLPEWATGMPLKAEGWRGKRYHK